MKKAKFIFCLACWLILFPILRCQPKNDAAAQIAVKDALQVTDEKNQDNKQEKKEEDKKAKQGGGETIADIKNALQATNKKNQDNKKEQKEEEEKTDKIEQIKNIIEIIKNATDIEDKLEIADKAKTLKEKFFPQRAKHLISIDTTQMHLNNKPAKQVVIGLVMMKTLQKKNTNHKLHEVINVPKPSKTHLYNEFYVTSNQTIQDTVFIPNNIRTLCIFFKSNDVVHDFKVISISPKKTKQINIEILNTKCLISIQ